MEIIEKEIGELSEYENNSRTHSDEQIQQIIASINEFGFTNPLLINSDNGVIAGHGRLRAAVKAGMDKVPCIILKGLTEAQERAYVIADNKIAMNAGWDVDVLRFELEELKAFDFDLELMGFDSDLLTKLMDIDADLPTIPDGDRDLFQTKTFTLHDDQAQNVDDAITLARTSPLSDTGINENSNGNALALICQQWLDQKNV